MCIVITAGVSVLGLLSCNQTCATDGNKAVGVYLGRGGEGGSDG